MSISTIAVFCGSSPGNDPRHGELATALGTHLGEQGVTLVYGGSDAGLMGRVADAHMEAGGHAVGIYPEGTFSRDVSHQGLGELQLVDTMHQRKAAMYDRSDAVIALPGGYGTLEELFEALTWTQLGLHALPAVLLDAGGFWDPFVQFLDSCVDAGFLTAGNRQLLGVAHDPTEALSILAEIDTAYREKWSGR